MSLHYLPNHFSDQCFLVALVVTLLSTSSDACGEPPTYENMKLIGDPKTSYGTGEQVQYSCRPGYIRRPTLKVSSVCAKNGQWSPISKDACYKKSCQRQDDPVNGQVNLLNGSSEFGTQIQFVCNPGFFLIGQRILHCLLKGSDVQWDADPPTCSKILCKPPPSIENGELHPSNKDVFEYQEVATYKCKSIPGQDELSLVGESRIYCSENRSWSSDPPQCKVVKCPYPVIVNGTQTSGFKKKYSYKARVVFECNQGLFLHGSSTVTCEGNSTWHPPIPTCRSEPPPPPPLPTSIPIAPSSTGGNGLPLYLRYSNRWIISLIMMAVLVAQ